MDGRSFIINDAAALGRQHGVKRVGIPSFRVDIDTVNELWRLVRKEGDIGPCFVVYDRIFAICTGDGRTVISGIATASVDENIATVARFRSLIGKENVDCSVGGNIALIFNRRALAMS